MTNSQVGKIQRIVWAHYKKLGRHDLPWRQTSNPYRILVSEIMLQQTQVARVKEKYRTFLRQFPNLRTLAEAPRGDVITAWQGLGYNRRAKALHEAARHVVSECGGRMPRSYEELLTLPGVGPYTAGAVCAFAYNQATPLLETNIRTVLLYHCLKSKDNVSDRELLQLSKEIMDIEKPREWYWALMDYGAWLKGQGVQTNSRSRHYTKQSKFKGSDREVRGAIVRLLATKGPLQEDEVLRKAKTAPAKVRAQLEKLRKEGMLQYRRGLWCL